MNIYGDPGNECYNTFMSLYKMIAVRQDHFEKIIKEWDEEEKKPIVDEASIKKLFQRDSVWRKEDREFVKKLLNASIKAATECSLKRENSLKDVFLAQATKLEDELAELDKKYPLTKTKAGKAKRRKK